MTSVDRAFLVGAVLPSELTSEAVVSVMRRLVEQMAREADRSLQEMTWLGNSEAVGQRPPVVLDWDVMAAELPEDVDQVRIVALPQVPAKPEYYETVSTAFSLNLSGLTPDSPTSRVAGHVYATDATEDHLAEAAGRLRAALTSLHDVCDVATGFVSFDLPGGVNSPYEDAVGLNPFHTNYDRYVCGYFWGNLLTRTHIDELGGVDEIKGHPGIVVTEGPGWWWLQLDEPYPTCDRALLHRMRDLLDPVLPRGIHTVDEYAQLSEKFPAFRPRDYCL